MLYIQIIGLGYNLGEHERILLADNTRGLSWLQHGGWNINTYFRF